MDTMQMVFLISIWVLPISYKTVIFLKLNPNEKEEFKHEMRKPSVFLGIGIPAIGLLVFLSGKISEVKMLNHIGAAILIVSLFEIGIEGLIKKERSLLMNSAMLFGGVVIAGVYIYSI